jgi:uncharacterized protein (TIGR03083 family)
MEPTVTSSDLLAEIRAARADWDALIASVPREGLTEPGLPGGWTIKDVLAHIAWGEREAVGLVRARALVGSDLWRLSDDECNAIVYEQNSGRPLDEVLAESSRVHADYVAALESLTDEELNDPAHFNGMPATWRPWRTVHDPHHYPQHAADIRAWLSGGGT